MPLGEIIEALRWYAAEMRAGRSIVLEMAGSIADALAAKAAWLSPIPNKRAGHAR